MTARLGDLGNDSLAVQLSDDGVVARARIHRPDVRNALNDDVIEGLIDVLPARRGSETAPPRPGQCPRRSASMPPNPPKSRGNSTPENTTATTKTTDRSPAETSPGAVCPGPRQRM